MSLAIYRKYRPQTFAEVIGQDHIKRTLQNEIRGDKIAHAYLFCGARGLGKTTIARILAKAINCEKRESLPRAQRGEPCNQCQICKSITDGRSFDLIEVDAASNRGINEIRELRERVRFRPARNKYKVFVLDEAHMLTSEAFNALLKTLEEPPEYVVFILATTEPHKLPDTIISRCQRFDFKKVKLAELVGRLEKIVKAEGIKKIEKGVLENIARHGEGCVRDAETLLGKVLALGGKELTQDLVEIVIPRSQFKLVAKLVGHLVQKDSSASLGLINQLIEEGIDLKQFNMDLIEFLRKLLLVKISTDLKKFTHELDGESEKQILNLSQKIDLPNIVQILELLIKSQKSLEYADIPQLPLELVVLRMCGK